MFTRIFNVLVSICIAPVIIPLILVAGLLIKLNSSGPMFFRQKRLGYRKKVFTCIKLRTMSVGTPNAASHEVGTSHITSVGRWLRRLKIDEFPQLWNVFCGDMSFVGPRPGLPDHDELTKAREAQGVFEVVPGITGLSQINGIDMSDPELLAEWDRRYAEEASFFGDLKLMVQTVVGKGSGDAAENDG